MIIGGEIVLESLMKIGNGIRFGIAALSVVSGVALPFMEERDESIVINIFAIILCFLIAYAVLPKRYKDKIKGLIFRNKPKEPEHETFDRNSVENAVIFENMESSEPQMKDIEGSMNYSNTISSSEIEDWTKWTGIEFDNQIAKLLATKGFSQVRLVLNSIDQGTDILAEKSGIPYYFRCQSSVELLGTQIIRDIIANNKDHDALKLVVVTNNFYTAEAKELAVEENVMLWNQESLSEL